MRSWNFCSVLQSVLSRNAATPSTRHLDAVLADEGHHRPVAAVAEDVVALALGVRVVLVAGPVPGPRGARHAVLEATRREGAVAVVQGHLVGAGRHGGRADEEQHRRRRGPAAGGTRRTPSCSTPARDGDLVRWSDIGDPQASGPDSRRWWVVISSMMIVESSGETSRCCQASSRSCSMKASRSASSRGAAAGVTAAVGAADRHPAGPEGRTDQDQEDQQQERAHARILPCRRRLNPRFATGPERCPERLRAHSTLTAGSSVESVTDQTQHPAPHPEASTLGQLRASGHQLQHAPRGAARQPARPPA